MSILNVDRDADPNMIKAAYRKLVLEHHPDRKNGDDVQFKKITAAYHALTDGEHQNTTPEKPAAEKSRWGAGPADRAKWGAGPTDKVPEEDWSRYTTEFEEDTAWWKAYENRFWQEYEGRMGSNTGAESEKAQEPRVQPDLQVDVDQSLCIGCCSCETIAPDVFEINRNAKSNPKSSVKDSRGAGVNRIMNAAETCPTKAIMVDNVRTGERLYPF
jgi:DnaJ-class molecular chaperone